ncbi:hypothetical protein K432DRAFT_299023 [Lepidopterella palustris CBS 459.81]|uniref:Uncharacterized protein n=1 Tax=Lepidopterella palustris CBS 459.81 TaxID=1314670 RepID=A0A8E2JEQ4_9PEZI|nr:hypothetical protein K432DRAFT_299023 [Lepidopterella palustris CBS 459.81]
MTFSDPIITRPPPSSVTYNLSSPHQTIITLPPNSSWTSGLHWHSTHTEYLLLLRGSIHLRLNSVSKTLSALADGSGVEVTIPQGARHEWERADAGKGEEGDGEEVLVIERTDPNDGEKSLFFWNLNGVVMVAAQKGTESRIGLRRLVEKAWMMLSLLRIFWELDNWPVFLDLGGMVQGFTYGGLLLRLAYRVEWIVAHLILGAASALGKVFGMKAVRKEMTPKALWNEWESRRANGGKTS